MTPPLPKERLEEIRALSAKLRETPGPTRAVADVLDEVIAEVDRLKAMRPIDVEIDGAMIKRRGERIERLEEALRRVLACWRPKVPSEAAGATLHDWASRVFNDERLP